MKTKLLFYGLLPMLLFAAMADASRWRNRRPVIESFTASATSVTEGESVTFTWRVDPATATSATVGFESPYYTYNDPLRVPLSGSLKTRPTKNGEWLLIARNRRRDLNNNGRSDGWRRSSWAAIYIEVKEK